VLPEILDRLPHNHPDAVASRRDITLLNRVCGARRWWLRRLPELLRPGERVLELGAGGGELAALLRSRMPALRLDGLEVCPRPLDWPALAGWHQVSALEFDRYADYDAVIANLLLHQFTASELAVLGRRLATGPRLLVFSEVVRRRQHQWMLRAARVLGINHVTRHDGHVSIQAGFRDRELPAFLGLDPAAWSIHISESPLGIYRMVAGRRTPQ